MAQKNPNLLARTQTHTLKRHCGDDILLTAGRFHNRLCPACFLRKVLQKYLSHALCQQASVHQVH